ncbi:Nucleoside-diphosphate-sugar epimerase [Flavobacterium gillisiae]|uniref:Nucleoside-diphosphate-sugar epimerase n=1 Tax=Flavobacterium gillisiae TaxID=150146 RepID=A0A1H3YZB6_9FLAO|nr:NAD(P)-dependent oxidoreductase [Flavobacterium gillisiae]SEA16394.1 Nucleoside-diphosphate-sugar epimerase [Flavobacterium gillisiae]
MKNISVLGCGWLGFPLAEALLEKGFRVNGTTTSTDKISKLEKAGIHPFLISIETDGITGAIEDFLKDSSILIIDIPPKLRGTNKENFVSKIEALIPFIEKSTIENVIFISSTSVYGDANDQVTEETPLNPDCEGGKQLAIVEGLLHRNSCFKTTILRFGGLIGEDRNPIKFIAGRENMDNPDAPINLIHQADCIGIILKIIEKNSWGETYNAATPVHPSREVYYTQKALELNLVPPTFKHDEPSVGKTILTDKLVNKLGYTFTIMNL